MSSERYLKNKSKAFELKGLDVNNHEFNCHHVIFKSDVKKGLVSKDFDINAVDNLLPLPHSVHNELHRYIKENGLENDITCRANLAHLAEIGELEHCEMPKTRKKSKGSRGR